MSNLELWERFEDIDPKFTKAITGRDYGGTSPNPQYVIRCLTEMFGPVGKGFGWNVIAEGFQPLGDVHLHWCRIRFWWNDGDKAHSVEEYGQTKAAYTTRKGDFRIDEDAPKKSLTDAIIKGASHLGIAANIFLGRWDDQKYVAQVNDEYRQKEAADQPHAKEDMAVCDRLLEGLNNKGPELAENEAFQKNLAALRNNAPALAANVDALIEELKKEAA